MKPLAYLMVVFLLLLTSQAAAQAPTAARASLAPRVLALEEEGETEEEGEGEESEAEEEDEAETGRSEPGLPQSVPDECLEYTVAARVVSSLSRHTVRLEVSYDSSESGLASLSYSLKGGKGKLKIGAASWRLTAWGNFEQTAHLSDRELVKLQAARSFTVRVKMPGTPSYCEIYRTRQLILRHQSGGQTVWSERSSGTQPLRRPSLQH